MTKKTSTNEIIDSETIQESVEELVIKPVKTGIVIPVISKYKLNLYNNSGSFRSEIPKGILHEFTAKYGDIMRTIPTDRFVTLDEISQIHSGIIKRLGFDKQRSLTELKEIIDLFIDAGLILRKDS